VVLYDLFVLSALIKQKVTQWCATVLAVRQSKTKCYQMFATSTTRQCIGHLVSILFIFQFLLVQFAERSVVVTGV
jgi:hypothetical protein